MGFNGLLELSDEIKEVDDGLGLNNSPGMFEKNVLFDLIDLELSDIKKERDKEAIVELLKIICRDKTEIDDEVRYCIQKLNYISTEDLESLISLYSKDPSAVLEFFNQYLYFDVGFTKDDYANCAFSDSGDERICDVMPVEGMKDSFLRLLANASFSSSNIKKLNDKVEARQSFRTRF